MKSLLLSFLLVAVASFGYAQTKTETMKVSGECGSCKKKIESAAKKAGATYALWDVDSKELTIKYNSTSTNSAKIQKAIADVGYDTPDFKASDEAYNKLDGCCQYERTNAKEKKSDEKDKE
jgi:copper chaperone CopZ